MNPDQQNEALLRVKWFLLLERAAFICNIFFVIYVVFTYTAVVIPQWIVGVILSIGFVLSPLLNIVVNIALIYLILKHRSKPAPPWIITVNIFFLFFQIFYFLFG